MYDINWIKANAEAFDRGLKRRGLEGLSASLLAIDSRRREAIVSLNEMQEKLAQKEGSELDRELERLDHFKSIQHELESTAMH